MVDMTYESLASDLGTSTADGLRNAANVAGNFACTLYQNSPASAVGVDPTGVGTFTNALWSRLCAPRGQLPALPAAPPFNGGQCSELYDVTLTVVGGSDTGPAAPDTRTFNDVQGPLQGWQFLPDPSDPEATIVNFNTAGGPLSFGVQGLDGYSPQVSVDSIVPVDGTDSCGNPPPVYPPDRAPLVEFTTNVNVDFGGITIPVTVEFNPTVWVVPIIFAPQISVNVGPINVTFGKDGVTFAPNFDIDTNVTLPPGIDPRTTPPPPKPPTTTSDCDLDPVIEKLDELLECDRCDKCYVDVPTDYGNNQSNVVSSLIDKPHRAILTFVSGPSNLPVQSGDNAPDILHAGWFSWRIGNAQVTRQRLDYEKNVFLAPEGVTGFSYTGTYGTIWNAVVISKQEVDCP